MKTKLELHLAAAKFAGELLETIPAVELDKKILARATSDKVPDADYAAWKSEVLQLRARYIQMKTRPSQSARETKAAPAKK